MTTSSILTFSGLELGCEGEESLVLHVELGVQLGEDDDLRPPVLGVRWALLQPQEREAGGGESQTAKTIAPLLLGTRKRKQESCELVLSCFTVA